MPNLKNERNLQIFRKKVAEKFGGFENFSYLCNKVAKLMEKSRIFQKQSSYQGLRKTNKGQGLNLNILNILSYV